MAQFLILVIKSVCGVGIAMSDSDYSWLDVANEKRLLEDEFKPAEKDRGKVITMPLVTIKTSTLREWWREIKRRMA